MTQDSRHRVTDIIDALLGTVSSGRGDLKNEYREVFGDCAKYQKCSCCETHFHCKLPAGHGGECSPRRPS